MGLGILMNPYEDEDVMAKYKQGYKKNEELEQKKKMDALLQHQMRVMLEGGPPTFRVIAKFGGSNYDITITKEEEIMVVANLLERFRNSFLGPNNLF